MAIDMATIVIIIVGGIEMNNQDELIDLEQILAKIIQIIMKYFKYFIIILILSTILFPIVSYMRFSETYSSQMTFVVTREISGTTTFRYNTAIIDDMTETFQYIIDSSELKDMIKNDLGTTYVPTQLSLSKVESTNLFTIKAEADNPQDAYDTMIAFSNNYASFSRLLLEDATVTIIEEPELATSPDNSLSMIETIIKGFMLGIVVDMIIIAYFYLFKKKQSMNIMTLDTISIVIVLRLYL